MFPTRQRRALRFARLSGPLDPSSGSFASANSREAIVTIKSAIYYVEAMHDAGISSQGVPARCVVS
jgi:hypothetical protein